MTKIIIAYHSANGHTAKLAGHISKGVARVDSLQPTLLDVTQINKESWQKTHDAQAIIFGCPTYMGSVSGQFKLFMDDSSHFWRKQKWADKIAAGFTVGTSSSGDKLSSLSQISIFAAQHGMVWVGQNHIGSKHTGDGLNINEPGSWLGLMAQSDTNKENLIPEQDARTAILFGERIAKATTKWTDRK